MNPSLFDSIFFVIIMFFLIITMGVAGSLNAKGEDVGLILILMLIIGILSLVYFNIKDKKNEVKLK